MNSTVVGDPDAPREEPTGRPAARPAFGTTDVMLIAMATIWGANFTVVKFATQSLTPLAYNGVRVLLAAVALLALTFFTVRERPTRRDVLALLALGLLGNGLYQILFVEGVARTRPADASLVIAAAPAFIALLGRISGVERISARSAVGVALSIAGVAFVVVGAPQAAGGMHSTFLGNLLMVGSALCWAVYNILLKPYTQRINGVQLTAITMTSGAMLLVAFALPAIVRTDWSATTPLTWGAVVYSSLGALVIAYIFWYRGVRVIGATRTAIYSNLQPVIAMLIAWLAFGDAPGPVQIAGVVVITAGLALARQ